METKPDTIQTDVVDDNVNPEPVEEKKPVSQRDQVFAAAAAKRREEELGAADDAPEPETGDTPPAEDDMVELKVDGEVIKKTRQEVEDAGGVAAIQKHLTVERRMAIQAEERKRLEARERELQQREAAIERRRRELEALQAKETGKTSKEKEASDRELIRRAVEDIYDGDSDKATDALAQAIESEISKRRGQGETINKADIVKEVRWQMEHEEVVETFPEKFEDIANNPTLFQMTDQETIRVMREHPDWTPRKVIHEAATRVREYAQSIAAAVKPKSEGTSPQGDGATDLAKRQQRKQALDKVPAAAGRVPVQAPPGPKSKQDVFAEMKKARGQSV